METHAKESSTVGENGAEKLSKGLERHVWPSGNGKGIVNKTSSDEIFGPNGLGLAGGIWANLLSYLARTGIQQQTGSKPGETDIQSCVKGWGQGAYSSRVFDPHKGIDEQHLNRFIQHLQNIAVELNVPNQRITDKVLGVFITTQIAEPYSTIDGEQKATSMFEKLTARFRGHIQWQGFDTLCGQIDQHGIKHVSPQLISDFFNCDTPFFCLVVKRRKALQQGSIVAGTRSGLLASAPSYVDLPATDNEYKRNKSGFWLLVKIIGYMLFQQKSKHGPLLKTS
jgi:hypothetical protein